MNNFIDVQVIADDGLLTAINNVYGCRLQPDEIVEYCVGAETGRIVLAKTIALGMAPDIAEFDDQRRGKKRWGRALEHHGWLVETIDGVPTPNREAPYRADVDPLVIRAIHNLPTPTGPLSTVVLLAADHAFATAVRDARRRGWRVEIASVDRITADALRRAATDTIDITRQVAARSPNTGSIEQLASVDLASPQAA